MRVPGTCPDVSCDHELPCPIHVFKRAPDLNRPHSAARGYSGKQWHRGRTKTLMRDPLCTWPDDDELEPGGCDQPSTRADHHPRSRQQLVADAVENPDDPRWMRGLCEHHHNVHTGRTRR